MVRLGCGGAIAFEMIFLSELTEDAMNAAGRGSLAVAGPTQAQNNRRRSSASLLSLPLFLCPTTTNDERRPRGAKHVDLQIARLASLHSCSPCVCPRRLVSPLDPYSLRLRHRCRLLWGGRLTGKRRAATVETPRVCSQRRGGPKKE